MNLSSLVPKFFKAKPAITPHVPPATTETAEAAKGALSKAGTHINAHKGKYIAGGVVTTVGGGLLISNHVQKKKAAAAEAAAQAEYAAPGDPYAGMGDPSGYPGSSYSANGGGNVYDPNSFDSTSGLGSRGWGLNQGYSNFG